MQAYVTALAKAERCSSLWLYALSAASVTLWIEATRRAVNIAALGATWDVVVCVAYLGTLVLMGEPLTLRQCAGVAMAVVAVGLLA